MQYAFAIDAQNGPARTVWATVAMATLLALLVINPPTVVTAGFALLMVLGVAMLCLPKRCRIEVAKSFLFYCTAAIFVYLLQLGALPEYHGFSGPPWVGTDDSYFFSLGSPDIPADLPLRQGYYLRVDPYGSLLRVFGNLIYYVFGAVHPLDLVLINVALVALLPSLVGEITIRLSKSESARRVAWWLTLSCPFIVANSVVILRDGLMTTAYAGALLGLLERRPVTTLVWVGFAAYLRLQHGAMLIGILWLFGVASLISRNDALTGASISGWRILAGWLAPALVIAPLALLISGDTVIQTLAGSSVVREEFLTSFIAEGAARDTGTSTFYAITQLPWPIRLPAALAFYFLSPLFDITRLMSASIFVIRDYLMNLFAIAMIVYVALFVKGALVSIFNRRWTMISMFATLMICLSLISQASMQLRHKLPLMVLFYPIVAVGMTASARMPVHIAAILAAALVGSVEILFNGYKLL